MSKTFILPVLSGAEMIGVDCGLVAINQQTARRLCDLFGELDALRAKFGSEIYSIEAFDYSVEYYESRPVDLTEDVERLFEPEGDGYEIDARQAALVERYGVQVSVDCPTVLVTPDGVIWEAYLKHADVHFQTQRLDRAEIARIAGT